MSAQQFSDLLHTLATQQAALQAQVLQLTQTLNSGSSETKSTKSSIAKPEPFTGKATEVRPFLAFFQNWAGKQKDLKDGEDWIASALSFMHGEASDWAARFARQIAKAEEEGSEIPFPFGGDWDQFEAELKTRFGSIDEEGEARREIKGMKQGKQSAAQYAQKFQDVGSRTGFSDQDLMERFCVNLNNSIRMHMVSMNLGQGKPKDLSEAVKRACTIELAIHDPTLSNSGRGSAPDPYAMDIDATRTGNGKSREEFLQRMRGRCFGCGSADHIKSNCNWKTEKCRYCARSGHIEKVCQDKFMGTERNRGNNPRRGNVQRVAASQDSGSWSLFDDTLSARTPKPPPSTPSSSVNTSGADLMAQINALKEAMTQQNSIFATLMKPKEDF
jgi:hypothetical protein